MKKITLIAVLTALTLTAGAQNYQKVYGTFQPGSLKISESSVSLEFDTNIFSLGYAYGYGLSTELPLFVEAGAQFSFANSKVDLFGEDDTRINATRISIPVSLAYKLDLASNISLTPYAGIKGICNITAKAKATYDGMTETVDLFKELDDDMKRVQLGWQIGANLGVNNFLFGVGYDADITPIVNVEGGKANISGLTLTVGYLF